MRPRSRYTIKVRTIKGPMTADASWWFDLAVYDDIDDLRAAVRRSDPYAACDDAVAMWQPSKGNGSLGVMRVTHGTSREIVIHEAFHVAATFMRRTRGPAIDLGNQDSKGDRDPEELMAWMTAAFAHSALDVLYEDDHIGG